MSFTLTRNELVELIAMHGRTAVEDCLCPDCCAPIKSEMLAKVERMRQLIELLPEHIGAPEATPHRRDLQ